MPMQTPLQFSAYNYLIQKIKSNGFSPDAVYSEAKIAKELSMSRTPVREALQRLSQERYIDILSSRGFRLHKLSAEDIVCLHQVRFAIEVYCILFYASDAAQTIREQVLQSISENIMQQERCLEEKRYKEYAELDFLFHKNLVSTINNYLFMDAFSRCSAIFLSFTQITMTNEQRIVSSISEHKQLHDIILRKAPDEVLGWMHQHIDFATQKMLKETEKQN